MYEAETYGAKAASLSWLERTIKKARLTDRYRVPRFKAYSVTPPEHSGRIDQYAKWAGSWAQHIQDRTFQESKFAVRSGATISLPGLMDTHLNLTVAQVPEAVRLVYESFDNPQAQEALSKIPEKERPVGTGVIIQKMANGKINRWSNPYPTVYGVVFTASSNGFPHPKFRYADNPGDIVSNGEGLDTTHLHYGLSVLARRWMDEFEHPPEFEIAIVGDMSNPRRIWMLQARNQHLTAQESAALRGVKLVPPEDAEPVMKFDGGGLAQIGLGDDVVVLQESDPALALRAARNGAKLVLWRKGNPFSHAAVLCRSEGVAYGKILDDVFMQMPLPPYTFFDGDLYQPAVDLIEIERTDISDAMENTNWEIIKWIMSDGYQAPLDLVGLNMQFVTAMMKYKGYLFGVYGKRSLLEFAQMLVMVAAMTCAGEARHDRHARGMNGHANKDMGRTDVWYTMLNGQFQPPIEWLDQMAYEFKNYSYAGGYGGEKWRAIAANAAELAGLLNTFREDPNGSTLSQIDSMVTVMEHQEHNGAVYWTKLSGAQVAYRSLSVFDSSNSWDEFINRMMAQHCSTSYKEAVQRGFESMPLEIGEMKPVPDRYVVWHVDDEPVEETEAVNTDTVEEAINNMLHEKEIATFDPKQKKVDRDKKDHAFPETWDMGLKDYPAKPKDRKKWEKHYCFFPTDHSNAYMTSFNTSGGTNV